MNEKYSALRSNVSMLGHLLGNTIKDAHGEELLEKVETIVNFLNPLSLEMKPTGRA